MSKLLYILFITTLMILSCGSSNEENLVIVDDDTLIPTNLSINLEVIGSSSGNASGNGSGEITLNVSATNAVSYKINFGDGTEIESASKILSHKYSTLGTNTFTIQVIAFSKTDHFISDFVQREIFVSADNLKLVWADEFSKDGTPDPLNWTYDLGAGGWGNNELQTYTKNPENVKVENGFLKIIAKKNGTSYTSARLKTQGLRKFTYGKFEIRAKLPASKGTWPALWMLGSNFTQVGWPACGEMDIMEQKGTDKNIVLSTLHYPDNFAGGGPSKSKPLVTSTKQFHIYSIIWSAKKIEFFIDNIVYHTFINTISTPFNSDFFFIINIAMGGTLGGPINANFTHDTMEIDYIKVYQ